MFENILTATDMVGPCDASVISAAEIANQDAATLSVIHVLESAYSGKYRQFVKHYQTGEEIVADDEYEQAVKDKIDKSCSYFLNHLSSYEISILKGLPWEQILKRARDKKVGLIVLGPHSNRAQLKGVTRVSGAIGSTVEGVIKYEKCPVMIVNQPISKEGLEFKNIMVCVDFSRSCESALQFAVKFSKKHNSKIFVFHMFVYSPSGENPQDTLEEEVTTLRKRVEEFSGAIATTMGLEFSVRTGQSPHIEILKYAREKEVDLIVMGSHTRGNRGKWYVGSAVEKVSLRSSCPVVVRSSCPEVGVTDSGALARLE